MKVYLIRHGMTPGNLLHQYVGGRTDQPLSEEGKKTLQELKDSGIYPETESVFVSPMKRCAETAQILFPDAEQIIVEGLKEMDFGVFEGRNYRELTGRQDYQAWVDGGCLGPCPGGEDKAGFCRRVRDAFDRLMEENAASPALTMVAHGGTLMAILEGYGRPARGYFDWHCPCGSGFRLSADRWAEDRTLRLLEPVAYTGGT